MSTRCEHPREGCLFCAMNFLNETALMNQRIFWGANNFALSNSSALTQIWQQKTAYIYIYLLFLVSNCVCNRRFYWIDLQMKNLCVSYAAH